MPELNEVEFNKNVELLEKNLMLIRKAGGWSTETFSEMVGASRQTIINLENGTAHLIENGKVKNKSLYIAIMAVLDDEVQQRPDNDVLCCVLGYIFKSGELTDDNRDVALTFINGLTSKDKKKMGNEKISNTLKVIIGAASVVVIGAGVLLAKALSKKKF